VRKQWDPDELIEAWTLVEADWELVGDKTRGDSAGLQSDRWSSSATTPPTGPSWTRTGRAVAGRRTYPHCRARGEGYRQHERVILALRGPMFPRRPDGAGTRTPDAL
jgi:hypothetical protein